MISNKTILSIISSTLLVSALTTSGAEWSQYRGPNYDGISTEKLALKQWPANGLPVTWKVPTPTGFSSFSVGGGKVFTLIKRDGNETCVALDAKTGKELWAVKLSVAKFDGGGDSGGGGDGPRSTPTYNDGMVYAFDAQLLLTCIDATSGKTVWSSSLTQDYQGKNIQWQSAASPLVENDLVFVAGGGPGSALIALNKKTGKLAWKGENDTITHSSPIAATIQGVRQIIYFTRTGLVAVVPQTGKVLWRYKFQFSVSTAISPVVCGEDTVYVSAGYNVGAGLCKISKTADGLTATEVWRRPGKMVNHWSTPVYHNGYLYGMFSFKEYQKGAIKCMELATGKEMWSQPGFGQGNVTMVDGHLVALTDQGQVVLIQATPTEYKEISRMKAVGGKCWTTPVYCDGNIYVRSTTEGACLNASGK